MKVRELRAFLENVTDDLIVTIVRNDIVTELEEDDIQIVTFGTETFTGPTVLLINNNDEHKGESED